MTVMSKGSNIPLPDVETIRAVASWSGSNGGPDPDLSAVLLAETGKVRDQADFVFYNQPVHPGGAVRHLGRSGTSDSIELDLGRVDQQVSQIVVAASVDRGSFGAVAGLRLELVEVAGSSIAGFAVEDAGIETVFILGELYRRNGGWKFRAVGQGYAAGLAGLATDFGIEVDQPEPAGEPTGAPAWEPPPSSPAPETPRGRTPPVLFEWNSGGALVANGGVIARAARSWWRERAEVTVGGQGLTFRSPWGALVAETAEGTEVCRAERGSFFSEEKWDISGTGGRYGFNSGGFFTSRMLVERDGYEIGEILPDRWLTDRPQMELTVDIPDVDAAFLLWVAYVVRQREHRN